MFFVRHFVDPSRFEEGAGPKIGKMVVDPFGF